MARRSGRVIRLREHDVVLVGRTPQGIRVRLRPMTEDDWDVLLQWNSDPDVLYYAEGDDVKSRALDEVQGLYRSVSRAAYCFIIKAERVPVGECWLQKMNLDRILRRYPDRDCRRIDLMIGEKEYWGRGIGTETIRLLTEFGFTVQGADRIFAVDVADYNPRSRRAFERVGYEIRATIGQKPGSKASRVYDLVLTREAFFGDPSRV